MKVLQINNVYPYGSTGKITKDIHTMLINKGYDSVVCYSNGKNIKEKNVFKISNIVFQKAHAITSRLSGIMYGGCIFQTIKLIKIIKNEKPNIVHIQCINGHTVNIYKLIKWLKKNKINTVMTLHAEFMYTANCGHSLDCHKWKIGCGNCPRLKKETKSLFIDNTHLSWIKMFNAFKNFDNLKIISVSSWLMKRAKSSPILKDFEHRVILNGLDTNVFRVYNIDIIKKELGICNKKIVFHVTPYFSDNINNIKGGYYVIELAKKLEKDNVKILVAGDYSKNIKVPDNIILMGKIANQELLAKYYAMADVFLLTSKKETFSMTTAESLCCGTPVVGFNAGAPEQIAIKEYSSFVEYGDIDKLYNEIIRWMNTEKDNKLESIAKEKYSSEKMIKNYMEIYKSFEE